MRFRAGAFALACVLALAQVTIAAAAGATSDLVPGPPDASWQPFPEGTKDLTKVDLYGSQANKVQGFVDAYEKTWTEAPSRALIDRLEHYSSIFWASFRLGQAEAADKKDKTFTSYRTLPGLGSAAYEVTSGPDSSGIYTDAIVFTIGDYVSALALAGKTAPDQAVLMDQANRQLALIPAPVGEVSAINGGIVSTIVIAATAAGAISIIVCAVVLVVVLRRRRRVAARPQPQISPDGRYWWDGTAWRPIPPA
jgi:hypothetical protein